MSFLGLFLKIKKLWESWDLRSFLLLSFTFQCILILMASMRKRTSKRLLLGFICLAYLLADWAAYYAIGLIPSNTSHKYNDEIHAFWAPFLLLHIGGPNTIAGFSVEDNELWKRSVLHFFVQAGMTCFIIYRAFASNPLLWPTLFMFAAASTRYMERVLALYYASLDKFRGSVGKDSTIDLKLLKKKQKRGSRQTNVTQVQMVNDAYTLFQTYKRVFGSLPIKFDDNLKQARRYLLDELSPKEAFIEMEIQMNLAYDIFYTKMWLIIEQKIGKYIHPISLCCEASGLVLWMVAPRKTERYRGVDIRLTNTLVMGAVLVHVISFFKLIFSDLMIPRLTKVRFVGNSYFLNSVLNNALSIRDHKYGRRVFSRWSQTMPQFNLMSYIHKGLHKREVNPTTRLIEKLIGPKKHGERVVLSEDVKERVLKQIKYMASYANSQGIAEELCLNIGVYMHIVYKWEELKVILTCAGLVDALLVCHLATELLSSFKTPVTEQLSEYLMCLLVDEPAMVGSDGIGIKMSTFEETCENLSKVYDMEDEEWMGLPNVKKELEKVKKEQGFTTMRRSMLKYAHYIKDYLERLQDEKTAKGILEDIWVELLCHMAIKCRAWAHLEQLGSGGELLTVVWLLMTYVGLTSNFEPQGDE